MNNPAFNSSLRAQNKIIPALPRSFYPSAKNPYSYQPSALLRQDFSRSVGILLQLMAHPPKKSASE
jgi:hypothetical protein